VCLCVQLCTTLRAGDREKRNYGGAENAGVENAGVDSRGIATDELSR